MSKPLDLTAELADLRCRIEALEQRMYTISETRAENERKQKAVSMRPLIKGCER